MTREEINQIQWECQQLLNKATQLMDRGEWEALADCYTEDAVLSRPSDPDNGIQGRDAILASFRARPPRTSCHLLANTVFDVHGPDEVEAVSRVWLIAGPASDTLPVRADPNLMAGSFVDILVRVDGHWQIHSRRGGIELKYSYQ